MGTSQGNSERRRHRSRSRGQALMEFALITPLFFLIFFSILEFSLIMASLGSFNFAARDGARTGSLLGPTDATADSQILAAIRAHVQGIVMAKTTEVDIYRATSDGACVNAPTGAGTPTTVDDLACAADRYNLDGTLLAGSSIGWPVNDRNDSLTNGDYLGVRILYKYTYLTGFVAGVGSTLGLSATSVQLIEPQGFQSRIRGPEAEVVELSGRAYVGTVGAGQPRAWRKRHLGGGMV